jgi:selenide,water dikinase
LRFWYDKIPLTRGAKRYAKEWIFPGGASDNRVYFSKHVRFDEEIDEAEQMLLFDPQTSGGLLLCVPKDTLKDMFENAAKAGQPLWEIGEVFDGEGIQVTGDQ